MLFSSCNNFVKGLNIAIKGADELINAVSAHHFFCMSMFVFFLMKNYAYPPLYFYWNQTFNKTNKFVDEKNTENPPSYSLVYVIEEKGIKS